MLYRRKFKLNYNNEQMAKISEMSRTNPRLFWKLINRDKLLKDYNSISKQDFLNDFSDYANSVRGDLQFGMLFAYHFTCCCNIYIIKKVVY